jgi:hypothetical protein
LNSFRTFDADPFDGIMGLGTQKGSFLQSLINLGMPGKFPTMYSYYKTTDQIHVAVFGMYLSPYSIGYAELTLGGTDLSGNTVPPTYIPVTGDGSVWQLTSYGVYVNDVTSLALQIYQVIVFDTGTSNLVFPIEIAEVRANFLNTSHKFLNNKYIRLSMP